MEEALVATVTVGAVSFGKGKGMGQTTYQRPVIIVYKRPVIIWICFPTGRLNTSVGKRTIGLLPAGCRFNWLRN